jgi:WW domain
MMEVEEEKSSVEADAAVAPEAPPARPPPLPRKELMRRHRALTNEGGAAVAPARPAKKQVDSSPPEAPSHADHVIPSRPEKGHVLQTAVVPTRPPGKKSRAEVGIPPLPQRRSDSEIPPRLPKRSSSAAVERPGSSTSLQDARVDVPPRLPKRNSGIFAPDGDQSRTATTAAEGASEGDPVGSPRVMTEDAPPRLPERRPSVAEVPPRLPKRGRESPDETASVEARTLPARSPSAQSTSVENSPARPKKPSGGDIPPRLREAKLQAEQEAQERAEQEATEKAEQEARVRAEQNAKEQAEREARERAELEARERAEQEARERAEQDARAEQEAMERAEQKARERAEQEARAKDELEAAAAAARELEKQAAAQDAVEDDAEPAQAQVDSLWQETKTDDGHVYWWNTDTQETTWEDPLQKDPFQEHARSESDELSESPESDGPGSGAQALPMLPTRPSKEGGVRGEDGLNDDLPAAAQSAPRRPTKGTSAVAKHETGSPSDAPPSRPEKGPLSPPTARGEAERQYVSKNRRSVIRRYKARDDAGKLDFGAGEEPDFGDFSGYMEFLEGGFFAKVRVLREIVLSFLSSCLRCADCCMVVACSLGCCPR